MSFRETYLRALPASRPLLSRPRPWALFRHQAAHCPPYRAYLTALGRDLSRVRPPGRRAVSAHRVLQKPTRCARARPTGTPRELFLSSGTTQQQRSHHHLRDPHLYRANATRIFEQSYAHSPAGRSWPCCRPTWSKGNSSLVAMVAHFAQASGQTQPAFFLHDHARPTGRPGRGEAGTGAARAAIRGELCPP